MNKSFDPRKFNHTAGNCHVCGTIAAVRNLVEFEGVLDEGLRVAASELGIVAADPSVYIPQVKGIFKLHFVSQLVEKFSEHVNIVGRELIDKRKSLLSEAWEQYKLEADEMNAAKRFGDYVSARMARIKKDEAWDRIESIKQLNINDHHDMVYAKEILAQEKKAAFDKASKLSLPELIGVPGARFARQLEQNRKPKRDMDSVWVDVDGNKREALFIDVPTPKGAVQMFTLTGDDIRQYPELSVEKLSAYIVPAAPVRLL